MNKRRNISFYFSILVIALMTAFIIKGDKFTTSTYTDLITIKSDFEEILIKKPSSEIKLFMKDGKWFVGENAFPADQELIKSVENDLKSLKISDQISKGDYASKYNLDKDTAVEITITFENKVQETIFIGKKSSTNNHVYIKAGSKPEIYLAAGNIDTLISKTEDDFRNREIFRIPSDTVSNFEINHKGKRFSFIKKTEEKIKKGQIIDDKQSSDDEKIKIESWVCIGYENIKFDTEKVTALISDLNPLRAASYVYEEKKPSNPMAIVKIKSSGKIFELAIFEKKGDKYISKSPESAYLFNLDDFIAKKFLIENIEGLKVSQK